MKIGIQGYKASFHDVAARQYFGNTEFEVVEHATFQTLATALDQKVTSYAVMAIENTIAGSILPNYNLLERYGFKIMGEVFLRIEHHLMAIPGQSIHEILSVQSHPMALAQCQIFLEKYPHIQIVEAEDTAGSAKKINENRTTKQAAIASRLAAETYQLEILAESIETDRQNYTRFLIICRGEDFQKKSGASKASLRFEAVHQPGSLLRVLEVFKKHSMNLTKIQSVPILGRPYQYSFHVDLEWEETAAFESLLLELENHVTNLIDFGEYVRGMKPF